MGVWDKLWGKPVAETKSEIYRHGGGSVSSYFGGGAQITEEEALKIPAVMASIDLICGSIAQMPIMLVKKDDNTNEVTKIVDDERVRLINDEPNDILNGYTFKRNIVKDYLFYGSSVIRVKRDGNKVIGLYPLDSSKLTVKKFEIDCGENDWEIEYNSVGIGNKTIHNLDVLNILRDSEDGIVGRGILFLNADILKQARNENKYSQKILENGALPLGILQVQSKLSLKAFENLKTSFQNIYSGSDNAGKTMILEDGTDYKSISLDPNKLQLTDSKKSTIADIARLFNIPESMINSNANKYGANEANSLYFLQYCISPIVGSIESTLNKDLLLTTEKEQGYEFKFDTTKLLRMTRKERAEAVKIEYDAGLISHNEARAEIDRPKIVNKDYFKLGLGSVLHEYDDDNYIIPNTMDSKKASDADIKLKELEVNKNEENGNP